MGTHSLRPLTRIAENAQKNQLRITMFRLFSSRIELASASVHPQKRSVFS
jgi:hypothetical protein